MIPVFCAKVDHGKLTLADRDGFDRYLTGLMGEVEVVVRKPRKERSLKENSYYHCVVVKMIADYCGYLNPNDAHVALRELFLTVQERPRKTRSTTSLSTVEMEDYLAKIRMWAASELNLIIPEPNETL